MATSLLTGILRTLVLISVMAITCIFISTYTKFNMKTFHPPRWIALMKTKCGLLKTCAANFFAFKMKSGAANVVGPSLCFEDQTIMSPVKDNVGRGLNIVLVNGSSGAILKHDSFDMYSGDPLLLLKFLKEIPDGVLVLVASYDDPGSKLNDEIREIFSNLGSNYAKQLGFRDSWVFLGAKDLKNKSPYEQYLKNNADFNKYDGWPEMLEMEGCVPRKGDPWVRLFCPWVHLFCPWVRLFCPWVRLFCPWVRLFCPWVRLFCPAEKRTAVWLPGGSSAERY
ncbi:PREDICTED: protein FAM3D [Condylura cristata]|uniref:protein FAM3D n=1 Tax=Condylura cristata TaxID=143302 RepID=UPI00033468AE|nr:PREDICTED: protein FAM3D [Condylura cristata]